MLVVDVVDVEVVVVVGGQNGGHGNGFPAIAVSTEKNINEIYRQIVFIV